MLKENGPYMYRARVELHLLGAGPAPVSCSLPFPVSDRVQTGSDPISSYSNGKTDTGACPRWVTNNLLGHWSISSQDGVQQK